MLTFKESSSLVQVVAFHSDFFRRKRRLLPEAHLPIITREGVLRVVVWETKVRRSVGEAGVVVCSTRRVRREVELELHGKSTAARGVTQCQLCLGTFTLQTRASNLHHRPSTQCQIYIIWSLNTFQPPQHHRRMMNC